jgi:hypothetical protein
MTETTPIISIEEIAVETRKLGRMRVLTTVSDLARFLLNEWPETPGEKHRAALRACLDSLEGKLSGGACRIAFLEAAVEDQVWTMAPNRPEHTPGSVKPRWLRLRGKR